jgi:hypothetical protein
MEDIRKWKRRVEEGSSDTTTTQKIVKALQKVEETISNQAPRKGELKKMSNNVTESKRERKFALKELAVKTQKPT